MRVPPRCAVSSPSFIPSILSSSPVFRSSPKFDDIPPLAINSQSIRLMDQTDSFASGLFSASSAAFVHIPSVSKHEPCIQYASFSAIRIQRRRPCVRVRDPSPHPMTRMEQCIQRDVLPHCVLGRSAPHMLPLSKHSSLFDDPSCHPHSEQNKCCTLHHKYDSLWTVH